MEIYVERYIIHIIPCERGWLMDCIVIVVCDPAAKIIHVIFFVRDLIGPADAIHSVSSVSLQQSPFDHPAHALLLRIHKYPQVIYIIT